MDHKKAPWQPRGDESRRHGQEHNLTEEQKNLLACLRNTVKGSTSNESCTTRVRKPSGYKPLSRYPKSYLQVIQQGVSLLTIETDEDKKKRLEKEINRFESPFIWKPKQVKPIDTPEIIITRLQHKSEEIKDVMPFKWRNFIWHLVISYELFRAKKVDQALEEILSLEAILIRHHMSNDWMFISIKDALWHVVTVSRAFLLLEQGLVSEVEKLVHSITPVSMWKKVSQAGIHGIKAAVFMEYGHQGNINALMEALQAVEKDRTIAEWHYQVGKCMGRIRRVSSWSNCVDFLEVKAFGKANNLDRKNPLYLLYLAQALREQTFRDYKSKYPENDSELFKKLQKQYGASYFKYKKAKEMLPDCPHMLTRCAYGMIKLPHGKKELKFIRECIEKALELAPHNAMVYHVKGMYHERFGTEESEVLSGYEKAAALGNFGAAMDLVRVHYRLKQDHVIEELEKVAETFREPLKVQVVYAQAGSYLLFIKKNLAKAVEYFNKVIDIDQQSYAMMFHKPLFFRFKDHVNLFHVLLEELDQLTDWNSFPDDERKVLKEFRIRARHHDHIPGEIKKRPTVQEILDISNCYVELQNQGKLQPKRKRTPKVWRGKKVKVLNGERNKNKSQNKSEGTAEIKCSTRERQNKDKGASTQNRPVRERTSSVSSVDSDCSRERISRRRGFFSEPSTESFHGLKDISLHRTQPIFCEYRDSSIAKRFIESGRVESSLSRGLAVNNTPSSNTDNGSRDTNLKTYQTFPASRSSLNFKNDVITTKEEDYSKSFSRMNLGPKRLSMMSLSSSESGSETSCTEQLSVMDRVKQSYANLSYKTGTQEQNKGKKKKHFPKKDIPKNVTERYTNLCRSGSTQSLNEQPISSVNIQPYKPKFVSPDSGAFINTFNRSLTFLPHFARKRSESDSETK